MHATTKNCSDVKKYFHGTFVIVPEYDPNKALYVETVTSSSIFVSEKNGDKGQISLEDGGYLLQSPLTLRRQWFQDESCGRPTMITRIPARMWKKGIHAENTDFFSMHAMGNGLVRRGFSAGSLYSFMENKDKFPETLPDFGSMDANTGAALSPLWAVQGKTGNLFLLDSIVGRIATSRKRIMLLKEFASLQLPKQLAQHVVIHV